MCLKKKKRNVPVNGHPDNFQSVKQQSHAETDITTTQELPNKPGSSHKLHRLSGKHLRGQGIEILYLFTEHRFN